MIDRTQTALTRFAVAVLMGMSRVNRTSPRRDIADRDRGDVPGWVMITLMTAIVVVGLLAVFRGEVTEAVRSAFSSIR